VIPQSDVSILLSRLERCERAARSALILMWIGILFELVIIAWLCVRLAAVR
jgi:hypothetical protein